MDNNKIFEKVKIKIAISNVKEEDIVMNKRKLNIGKGIGIAACVVLSTTGAVLATTQIFNKFGANSSDGIQTAIENGYYSDINTEYKEANGISKSIESFLIDNDNFDMNFNISDYENSLYNYDKIDLLDENVEEISKIEEKLKNMKKIDKTIFLDFYYSSKSIKDIAKEQKISEFCVKQRLYRIRNKIRKEEN